jgi:lipoate-protein ligase A
MSAPRNPLPLDRSRRGWRVIDTGLRSAAENIAIDRAILEAHQQGHSPHTLRFLRFTPSALLGFHQHVEQELHVDYCERNGIEIQRRITGGGAIYFDETQIGWELYVDRRTLGTGDMTAISERLCSAAARGIRRLGVDARYRPRNDIEVNGRKVSGTGGAFDGDSLLFQGTLLLDFDVEKMLRALRISAEKLSDKAIQSARERVANLRELLGEPPPRAEVKACLQEAFAEEFHVEFEASEGLTSIERERHRQALAEIGTVEWIYQANRPQHEVLLLEGVHRCPGGLLRAYLSLDSRRGRIKQVWLSGDFFVNPRRMVIDLEAALRDIPVSELEATLHDFFASYPTEMLLLEPNDFLAVIRHALDSGEGEEQPSTRAPD